MALTETRATLDDLYRVEGKAELVHGRIVHLTATGHLPGRTAFRVARSLDGHAESEGKGVAYPDNVGFAVRELSSGRESFSPDASYYDGPLPANPMRFIPGPPAFAVEVRSENDYGADAEEEPAAKRADYFEAGTQVVWDVDPLAEVVRAYRSTQPERAVVFGHGQEADEEPAVPGWKMSVDTIFPHDS